MMTRVCQVQWGCAAVCGVVVLVMGVLGVPMPAQAQSKGIYTCVDGKGRKLTSDRPIAECADREQKVLSPGGTVQRVQGPVLTAPERADLEAKERVVQEEQSRKDEDKRRDRALLTRYPNKAVHDKERAEALKQIGVVKAAAANRVTELNGQRTTLADEMEFYKKDPSKVPGRLRRQVDEVTQSLAVQARFITDQDGEIGRVNLRFDEEAVRLKQLWAMQATAPAAKR